MACLELPAGFRRRIDVHTMDATPLNILLVEDEPGHRELIRRAFEPFKGRYQISVTGSVQDALAVLAASPPDLLITDLLLPDGKGSQLLPSARGDAHFPVIVMTSHGDEQVAVEAMKAGALDYIVKSAATLSDMPHIAERSLREWAHIIERKRAEEELRRSLHEKTLLLQEIHHRTRNNMQVIDSLLEFQSHGIEDPLTLQIFHSIRNRIRSMALVQEKLYSKDLATVNLKEYLEELSVFLLQSYWKNSSKIDLRCTLEPLQLSIDTAIPCGLMMNELLSNALHHAFPDHTNNRERKVWISLEIADDQMIEFRVGDNGRGLPDDVDIAEPSTLGFRLIQMLIRHQLRGNIQCTERHHGTQFLVRFNPPQYKKRI